MGDAALPDLTSPGHVVADPTGSNSIRLEFGSPLLHAREPLSQVDCGEAAVPPTRALSSPSPLDRAHILSDSPYLSRSSPDRGLDLDGSRVIIDSTQSTPSLPYDPRDSTIIVPRTLGVSRSAYVDYDQMKYRFQIPDGQRPGYKLVVQLPGPEVVALDWSGMVPPSPYWRGDLARAAGLRSPGASPGAASSLPGGEAICQDILDTYRNINADIEVNNSEIRQLDKEVRFLRSLHTKQSEREATETKKQSLLDERAMLLGSVQQIAKPRTNLGLAASPRATSPSTICTSSQSSRSRPHGNGRLSLKVGTIDNGALSSAEGSGISPATGASVVVPPPVKSLERPAEAASKCPTPWLRSPAQDFRQTLPTAAMQGHPRRASLPPPTTVWCGSVQPPSRSSAAHLGPAVPNNNKSLARLQAPLAQAAPQPPQPLVTYRATKTTTPRSTFGYPSGLAGAGIGSSTSRAVLPQSRVTYSRAGGSTVVPHGAALRQPSPQVQPRCEYAKSIPVWGVGNTQRWFNALGA